MDNKHKTAAKYCKTHNIFSLNSGHCKQVQTNWGQTTGNSLSDYSCMPGITATDYISTHFSLSLLTSANEIAHEECGRRSLLQSCDIIFLMISTVCCSCYMQCLGCECVIISGFPPVVHPFSNRSPFQIGAHN